MKTVDETDIDLFPFLPVCKDNLPHKQLTTLAHIKLRSVIEYKEALSQMRTGSRVEGCQLLHLFSCSPILKSDGAAPQRRA